jgi:hypothetical protein
MRVLITQVNENGSALVRSLQTQRMTQRLGHPKPNPFLQPRHKVLQQSCISANRHALNVEISGLAYFACHASRGSEQRNRPRFQRHAGGVFQFVDKRLSKGSVVLPGTQKIGPSVQLRRRNAQYGRR